MKKNFDYWVCSHPTLKKLIMELKIAILIVLTSITTVFATDTYSQVAKVSLDMENKSLEQVMDEIERQSEFYFIFNQKQIDVNKVIDISADNKLITDILPELFVGTNINFLVLDRKILLTTDKVDNNLISAVSDRDDQQNRITGRVTDTNGSPIVGANVVVTGTTIGVITDYNGNYSIDAPQGSQSLTFSFIGMVSQEIPIGTSKQIDVILEELAIGLEEVVVTGYSVQRKKDITGSVAVVDIKQLQATPASNFGQQLQGKAASVFVGTLGAPGSPTMVRIRGIGTVNNNGPLYIIDGVSSRTQNLNFLNPNDIESLQILKDASAASIYGAQASNGVIIITTKKGSKGGATISYDAYYSVSTAPKFPEMLSSRDQVNTQYEAMANASTIRGLTTLPSHPQFGTGLTPVFPRYIIPTASDGPFTVDNWTETNRITEFDEGTDWYSALTQKALTQSHNLTMSGASETGQYLMSLSYFDQPGTYKYTYYKRYSMRSNAQLNIRNWLRAGENFTASFADHNRSTSQGEGLPMLSSYKMAQWVPLYDIAGNFAGTKAAGSGNAQSPLSVLYRAKDNNATELHLLGNVFAEADITPDMRFRTSLGVDHTRGASYAMAKKVPESAEGVIRNNYTEGSNYNFRYLWTNTLNYEKTFSLHEIKALIGSEFIRDGIGRSLSAQRFDYTFEDNVDTWTLANGGTKDMTNNSSYNGELVMFGIFARLDYVFNNRYLLTGIIRRDGSSRFSQANRYGLFPSISAGWRISEESFFKNNIAWLSDLKLRAGYGITGNSEIPRTYNYANEFGTNAGSTNYDLGATQSTAYTGYSISRFGNDETKWESTSMFNFGLDATLFKGKLDASIEYYVKETSDMLVLDNYNALAGKASPPYVNLGSIQNKGWDFVVNHKNTIGKVEYNIGVNLGTYKNKVLKLNNIEGSRFWGTATRFGNICLTEEGSPIAQFYGYNIIGFYESDEDVLGYKGITGEREGMTVLPYGVGTDAALRSNFWVGKYKFEDKNGDGRINASDQHVIGNPHPKIAGGMHLGIAFANFDLNADFYGTYGNDIYNLMKWFTDFNSFAGTRSLDYRDKSWEPGKTDATLPILDASDNISNATSTSYYIEDGSYLRLQNLTLGYNLPNRIVDRLKFKSLRVYVQGSNLFTLTKFSGVDPDITNADLGDSGDLTRGVDFGHWPQPKQMLFGINVSF